MENFVKRSLLFDFYGDLLTEHQRDVYEACVLDNLTLAETAEEFGISRQAVHDIVKRCENALEEYEDKLQLVAKFMTIKEKVKKIEMCADLETARETAREILELY